MGLKLPEIRQNAGPSFNKANVNAPLAVSNSISRAGASIYGAFKDFQENETKRQVQEANNYLDTQDYQFQANYGGKEEYSIPDNTDENFIGLIDSMEIDESITSVPAYKVYPSWRAENYKKSIEEAAKRIKDRTARDKFLSDSFTKQKFYFAKDSLAATDDQRKYIAKQTKTLVDSSLLEKDYSRARKTVKESALNAQAKADLETLIDKRQQTDYFDTVIGVGTLSEIRKAMENISNADEATTSLLNPTEEKAYMASLRRRETSIVSANKSTNAEALKLELKKAKDMEDALSNGYPVNRDSYAKSMLLLKNKYPNQVKDMERAWKFQNSTTKFMISPPSSQNATINKLEKEIRDMTSDSSMTDEQLDKIYYLEKLKKVRDEGLKQRKTDTMGWAQKSQIMELQPIDYSSDTTLVESLKSRIPQATALQNNYGTFTGFLTEGELNEFGSRLENLGTMQQLAFLTSVNRALGEEYAPSFYRQLKDYGIGGSAPAAGEIASRGGNYIRVADMILKGSEKRKTDEVTKLKFKEQKSEIDAFIQENFSGLYGGDYRNGSSMVEAFKDMYAITGDMEAAYRQITGGAISYNGYNIVAPKPDISGSQYRKSIYEWDDETWNQKNFRANGYTPSQLRKQIIDGSLIQIGIEPGKSFLVYKNDPTRRVESAPGVPYIFRFNDMENRNYDIIQTRKSKYAQEGQRMPDPAMERQTSKRSRDYMAKQRLKEESKRILDLYGRRGEK